MAENYQVHVTDQEVKGVNEQAEEEEVVQENGCVLVNTSAKSKNLLKCEFCSRAFRYPSGLKIHLRIHTGERPYECEFCSATFPQLATYLAHLRIHTNERPFQCTYCDKSFIEQSALKRHELSHTGEKRYSCEVCGAKFKQNSHLKLHRRTHTDEKPYKCEFCEKRFRSMSNRNLHVAVHTDNRPFQCPQCESRFIQKSDLTKHVKRLHNREREEIRVRQRFSCDRCEKTFCSAISLKDHGNFHDKIKPYTCEICGNHFGQISAWKRHVQSHDKRFECELCHRRFTTNGDKRRHMVNHLGVRPFVCAYCDKGFARRSSMNSHVRKYCQTKMNLEAGVSIPDSNNSNVEESERKCEN